MLVQKTTTGQRPEADEWTEIDMTSQISGITSGSYISESNMISNNLPNHQREF